MARRIEDYALIGDTQTAALVGKDGSIDWMCLPRFDSGAIFAALLGDEGNGRWLIAPTAPVKQVRRRYLPETLVLETEFETDEGKVRLYDFMPPRDKVPDVARLVEGVEGAVEMRVELVVRPDYGSFLPWVRRLGDLVEMIAGPDAFSLRTPVRLVGQDFRHRATFRVGPKDRVPFRLSWHASHLPPMEMGPVPNALEDSIRWWRQWFSPCTYRGRWKNEVHRSLVTLKALTYAPTGGIVAAATTSLPEQLGGVRNWDYRYTWLRDATFTLLALMQGGFTEEAVAWRDWLLRAVAGDPAKLQIMYGAGGERRLPEWEIPWLAGYEGSKPVRIGNAAVDQRQLDVYGEVIDALHQARRADLDHEEDGWSLQRKLLDFLESSWSKPDEGIWEVRGPRRHFTHSKVMAWVAFDRAVQDVESFQLEGPADRWRAIAGEIHREVCEKAWDSERRTFTQAYGSKELDASVLLMPLVGFLPPSDPRVAQTTEAIGRELSWSGFIRRYTTSPNGADGLPEGEGAFLACSFWYADNLCLIGRCAEAEELFDKLRGLANDVGLLAEEYDPTARRMLGNFPQAFSHVGLINTAANLSGRGPAHDRHRETRQRARKTRT